MEDKEQELRVFLVDIVTKDITPELLEDRMRELEDLLTTYGGIVVLKKFQKKDQPDYQTYVGKGKLEEIMVDMQRLDANLLIVGNVLKPSQIYHLNELLRPIGAKARDRVDLILKIFDKHATSMEARLQVELTAIRHMGPRIFGMGMELSKQGGNAGGGK
ncbi:MAG: hypothetical protein WCJ45_05585 [bacterium]